MEERRRSDKFSALLLEVIIIICYVKIEFCGYLLFDSIVFNCEKKSFEPGLFCVEPRPHIWLRYQWLRLSCFIVIYNMFGWFIGLKNTLTIIINQ